MGLIQILGGGATPPHARDTLFATSGLTLVVDQSSPQLCSVFGKYDFYYMIVNMKEKITN